MGTSTVAAEIELCARARSPVVYLLTWEEERAIALLERVAAALGARLYAWTQTRGMGPPRTARWDATLADPLAALDHIAQSTERALYALLDFHPFLQGPVATRKLRDTAALLASSAKTVVLVSPVLVLPTELSKDIVVLDLPLPDGDELAQTLDECAARAPVAADAAEREALLRAARGLTRREMATALAKTLVQHGRVDGRAVAAVLREKRQVLRKTGLLEAIETGEDLAAIGGLDALKRWLGARAGAFGERARAFGLPVPRGLLLVGVQGAGKSLCARAAAAAWQLPLLRLDVGAIFASAVGASEAHVRQAIALAEGVAPCVLWVDEIDKGFGGLEGSAASDAGTASRVFGTFLTWLQEKTAPVFVIATANAIELLPAELVRKGRFDEVFFVDLPAPAERLEIFRIHLARRGREPAAFDLETLAEASGGFAGAEIEQAVVAGLFHAFEHERELETGDVLRALGETVPLSRTMGERVDALRQWAVGRARAASTAGTAASRPVAI